MNSLVVPSGKTLDDIPLSLCGKQVVGPSGLPAAVAKSKLELTNRTNTSGNQSCL